MNFHQANMKFDTASGKIRPNHMSAEKPIILEESS